LAPQTRERLTLAALAVLFFGFNSWHPGHVGLVFASLVAFYALLYIAGGGRLPWKIKFRDYVAYLLISLGIVGLALLIVLYEAHKGQ
jgi:O-antigen/teichoic acid export membrane protein